MAKTNFLASWVGANSSWCFIWHLAWKSPYRDGNLRDCFSHHYMVYQVWSAEAIRCTSNRQRVVKGRSLCWSVQKPEHWHSVPPCSETPPLSSHTTRFQFLLFMWSLTRVKGATGQQMRLVTFYFVLLLGRIGCKLHYVCFFILNN